MTVTKEDLRELQLEQEFIKRTVSECIEASKESVEASKQSSNASQEVAKQLAELLSEMRVRDEQRKYEQEAFSQLSKKVDFVDSNVTNYIKEQEPIIARARRSQESIDAFRNAFISRGGQFAFWAILITIALLTGIVDLESIKKAG